MFSFSIAQIADSSEFRLESVNENEAKDSAKENRKPLKYMKYIYMVKIMPKNISNHVSWSHLLHSLLTQ